MVLLVITVLATWMVGSVAAGFKLGAVIRTAEKIRKDEFLDALFSTLASHQMAQG